MPKFSFDMPAQVKVAMGRESGDFLSVDCARLAKCGKVLPALLTAAMKVILINTYNGEGAAASHESKLAKATKKLDAWYADEFLIVERGDSQTAAMREAFIDEYRADNPGSSIKQAEGAIKATVAATFGEKESATFGRYIDAVATQLAKANDTEMSDERDTVEAYYMGLVEKAAKLRSASADKVKVPTIDLAKFKKSA